MALPYYPYFRGKQYELITIRECAGLMKSAGFVPIIEPVKESLGGLERTLAAICDVRGEAIVIVNPSHGDLKHDGENISNFLRKEFDLHTISAGILLTNGMDSDQAMSYCEKNRDSKLALVHAGFTEPRILSERLSSAGVGIFRHIFIEQHAGRLYRRHFDRSEGVLIQNGFSRQRNADYPRIEKFSELHLTFHYENVSGFGDFLIVGDEYSESGGPAYAVAIHLTFINPDDEDIMYIYHFISDTNDTPTDPAGKFAQALGKLVEKLESGTSHLFETEAVKEFQELHRKGHFPGLGFVKKLSMKHHIETLAHYQG
ncbi:MAG: sce7725 family protein [Candidatus Hydrogenedentes bacterium]|nr:sce7725 family protein [Candidatus Hydrogenedentota bacterium]